MLRTWTSFALVCAVALLGCGDDGGGGGDGGGGAPGPGDWDGLYEVTTHTEFSGGCEEGGQPADPATSHFKLKSQEDSDLNFVDYFGCLNRGLCDQSEPDSYDDGVTKDLFQPWEYGDGLISGARTSRDQDGDTCTWIKETGKIVPTDDGVEVRFRTLTHTYEEGPNTEPCHSMSDDSGFPYECDQMTLLIGERISR